MLCYNIHHGRGGDDKVDLDRIAKLIRDCRPDLVALQEVDNRTTRTGGVDQTHELARLTGMHGEFLKQIDYQGGEYGQALLSRTPIQNLEVVWLPGEPDRERRIVGLGVVEFAGRRWRFATTHLHHANADIRLEQAITINKLVAGDTASKIPTIIAGDFNAEPGSLPIAELSKVWTFPKLPAALLTFPASKPTKQIDYIAYHPAAALRVHSIEVLDEPVASDHRPVLAVFTLAKD